MRNQKQEISCFPEDLDEHLLNLSENVPIKLMHEVCNIAWGYLHLNRHI